MNKLQGQEKCQHYNTTASKTVTSTGIETAFQVPPDIFDKIWQRFRVSWTRQEHHSIILTIPVEDRVASFVISVPRMDAIQCGSEDNLPTIDLLPVYSSSVTQ